MCNIWKTITIKQNMRLHGRMQLNQIQNGRHLATNYYVVESKLYSLIV